MGINSQELKNSGIHWFLSSSQNDKYSRWWHSVVSHMTHLSCFFSSRGFSAYLQKFQKLGRVRHSYPRGACLLTVHPSGAGWEAAAALCAFPTSTPLGVSTVHKATISTPSWHSERLFPTKEPGLHSPNHKALHSGLGYTCSYSSFLFKRVWSYTSIISMILSTSIPSRTQTILQYK